MYTKPKVKVILLIFLYALIGGCDSKPNNKEIVLPTKKNVVIILTDDLGYGDISTYGQQHHLTPNIDRLAKKGVVFTDFYVPVPYCAPSRATLLTGKFPLRHGLVKNPSPDGGIDSLGISDEEITLGEVLQENGYRTKLIGKWHLGHVEKYFPTRHGFDEYFGILYSNDMRPVQLIENMDTVEYPVDQSTLTKRYTEKAVDFIRNNKDQQFFLHLCHPMPHKPLAASEAFYTPDTPDNLYDDVLRELDWSVGEITNELRDQGVLENTIVIFMSDNGPSWGGSTGEFKGMKSTNWEGGTRVPFIISGPGIAENKVVNAPAWSPDIYPTLLSMLDISLPENNFLDGENITEMINGDKTDHQPIFTLHRDKIITIRDGNWKLFLEEPKYYSQEGIERYRIGWEARNPDGTTIIAPAEQYTPDVYPGIKPMKVFEFPILFDLNSDPGETKNLANDNSQKVEELRASYLNFLNSFQ